MRGRLILQVATRVSHLSARLPLQVAVGVGTGAKHVCFRLPRFQRAVPSTSLDECWLFGFDLGAMLLTYMGFVKVKLVRREY